VAEAIEYEQFDEGPTSDATGGASAGGTAGTSAGAGAQAGPGAGGTAGTSAGASAQAGPGAGGTAPSDPDLSRLSDIPMELSVEIGRTHMTVGETLDLRVGSVVALERQAGEPADLLVNGTAIARGEVIVMDERYGLRVTEILESNQISASTGIGEATASEAVAATS
jgi:flagellar motor switch protein FliN/FliY